MRFAGVLPEDAPDPRDRQREKLALLPVPVMGLVPQPSLEDVNLESIASGTNASGLTSMAVSISYTLWRNPDDRSDPVNLADLDDEMRRSLEVVPPWPRPAWLVEQVERMHYPLIWEAVRTSWARDPAERFAPARVLLDHVNHVLTNRFRAELGLGEVGADRFAPRLREQAVNPRAHLRADGVELPAVEIDTDPYVYAIGAQLPSGAVLTAVLPRDDLPHLRVEFAERLRPAR